MTSARKLQRADRVEISNQRMIQSAISIILQRGISGLHLTDVGLLAGYSRGLATMRFGNKQCLLQHVADHLHQFWLNELKISVGDKRGYSAICAACDALSNGLQAPTQEIRVQFLIFFYSMDPRTEFKRDMGKLLASQRGDIIDWIDQAIHDREGNPISRTRLEAEASQILSSMIGIIYQSLMDTKLDCAAMFEELKVDILERSKRF